MGQRITAFRRQLADRETGVMEAVTVHRTLLAASAIARRPIGHEVRPEHAAALFVPPLMLWRLPELADDEWPVFVDACLDAEYHVN